MLSYPDAAFASSHQNFNTLIGHLTGEKTAHLDAAGIEAFLKDWEATGQSIG